jgi:hypothetical protein
MKSKYPYHPPSPTYPQLFSIILTYSQLVSLHFPCFRSERRSEAEAEADNAMSCLSWLLAT